jgi:hypothetical protein
MSSQQEEKGLDSALLLTLTMMTVTATLAQGASNNGQYLSCQRNRTRFLTPSTCGLGESFCAGCPVHCGKLSSNWLAPLSASRFSAPVTTIKKVSPGVGHQWLNTCNSSYLGGWDWDDYSLRPALVNSSKDPHPQNKTKLDWRHGWSGRGPWIQTPVPP